ncbi:helix-turn-helix domain-containing protein [Leucobacter sp. NPDC058333]|uniref:AraC family transcriptional regulator n=1 Tax=Leucobacter sp. NPDC058333 TaxID=3346450 RepID=UPI00365BC918
MQQDRRGVLYPDRLPEFHRVPAATDISHAVQWFWVPEWQLPDGVESRQHVLPFPACNLVVDPAGIEAIGPATRRSERVLTGAGWAVGALLRPAATRALDLRPAELRDATRSVADPALHAAIVAAMTDATVPGEARRAAAIDALSRWIAERVPLPARAGDGELANALGELLGDPSITRVDQLPERLHVSPRTLQRIAERAFGLPLHAMIRRRRLQEAAERLRDHPTASIAELAAALGYTDHAHFSTDFKAVLGVTPSEYRRDAAAPIAKAHRSTASGDSPS